MPTVLHDQLEPTKRASQRTRHSAAKRPTAKGAPHLRNQTIELTCSTCSTYLSIGTLLRSLAVHNFGIVICCSIVPGTPKGINEKHIRLVVRVELQSVLHRVGHKSRCQKGRCGNQLNLIHPFVPTDYERPRPQYQTTTWAIGCQFSHQRLMYQSIAHKTWHHRLTACITMLICSPKTWQ